MERLLTKVVYLPLDKKIDCADYKNKRVLFGTLLTKAYNFFDRTVIFKGVD